jgi:hypothetical protein
MFYIFMDNFRGFSRAIVPIGGATFLVGENSTGKTSFMSLVYLISTPQLWFGQGFSLGEKEGLGGFNDIISLTSKTKKQFSVGLLSTQKRNGNKARQLESVFGIWTFRNEEGMPRISRYIQFSKSTILKIAYSSKKIRYKTIKIAQNAISDDQFIKFFLDVYDQDFRDQQGYKNLPKDITPDSPLGYVLGVMLSLDKPRKKDKFIFRTGVPTIMGMSWIAPIRTKPKRTYDAVKTDFTLEGDHTPYVIRKTLESRDKAERFTRLLRSFGRNSGLFKQVDVHSFSKDPAAPFEVRIEILGGKLNISNVGYGVSQVLPVIVEMLTQPKGHWFVIQQPEIHIHPRAQAALGDLIHGLVKDQDHNYIVETHSDYLIDRFRYHIKRAHGPEGSRVVFFERVKSGNISHILPIDATGKYPKEQPRSFKRFFVNEEMKLLEI